MTARSVPFFAITVLALILSGCGENTMTGADILDFKDHPEHFKGKTLTIIDKYSGLQLDPAMIERDGGAIVFSATGEVKGDRHFVVFIIQIPKGLKVPGLASNDRAIVTFLCGDGNNRTGNVAIDIRRP